MAFCSPIWKLFFGGSQNSPADDEKNRLDKAQSLDPSSSSPASQKPIEIAPPREFTKEEKLKQKRREEIEKLRETLRNRKQLLAGPVEVPVRRGSIEGYTIRITSGREKYEEGKRRNTWDLEDANTKRKCKPTTRESMDRFSKFIEAKIKQIKGKIRLDNQNDDPRTKPGDQVGDVADDPLQDALINRLTEIQPHRGGRRRLSLPEGKEGVPRKTRRPSDPLKPDDCHKSQIDLKRLAKEERGRKVDEPRSKADLEKIAKRKGSWTKDETDETISRKRRGSDPSRIHDYPQSKIDLKKIAKDERERKMDEPRSKADLDRIAKRKGSWTKDESEGKISRKRRGSDPSRIDDYPKSQIDLSIAKDERRRKMDEPRSKTDLEKIAKRKGSLTKDASDEKISRKRRGSEPSGIDDCTIPQIDLKKIAKYERRRKMNEPRSKAKEEEAESESNEATKNTTKNDPPLNEESSEGKISSSDDEVPGKNKRDPTHSVKIRLPSSRNQ